MPRNGEGNTPRRLRHKIAADRLHEYIYPLKSGTMSAINMSPNKELGHEDHDMIVETKAERRENDTLQACHWAISLLKRWLLCTQAGAVREKHLQASLDEFVFCYNRRNTVGVRRIAACVIEGSSRASHWTTRQLINETRPCRWFASDYAAAT